MKTISALLVAVALVASAPAHAQKIDLSTIKCSEFIKSPTERIGFILMWLTGYYTGEDDPPVIDFDEMKERAKQLGEYCEKNLDMGLMSAAEEVFN